MSNQTRIREYFEKEAGDFDAAYRAPGEMKDFIRRLSYAYNQRPIQGRLRALLELVGDRLEGAHILEVGCGPGFYSIELAKKGAHMSALDFSESMITAARINAQRAGVPVEFIRADFTSSCPSQTYDYVFATGVVEYIEPALQQNFLCRMAQLSKGIVIVSFPRRGTVHALVRQIWLRWFKGFRISFFDGPAIDELARATGLQELERRDVGILWVIKFRKI